MTPPAQVAPTFAGGVTAYSWDVLNRLTAIDFADGTSAQYRYDAQGRRIEKAVNGAVTRYVYDADAILLEYDGGNGLQARYAHGEEIDQPLAMARGGQSYFYQGDHLGSIRLLTDAAGAIVNRYDYDAFGNLEATSFEGIANPYAFTAREHDTESGLMFYRARYYDPKIGRFISEDPIGFEAGDLNVHRYVYNNPLTSTDPSGQISLIGKIGFLTLAVVGTSAADLLIQMRIRGKQLQEVNWCEVGGAGAVVGIGGTAVITAGPVGAMFGELFGLYMGLIAAIETAAICDPDFDPEPDPITDDHA